VFLFRKGHEKKTTLCFKTDEKIKRLPSQNLLRKSSESNDLKELSSEKNVQQESDNDNE
jgi:hypothetical protein